MTALLPELALGDHACAPFSADADALQTTVDFTTDGLAHGDKVMVFTDTVAPTAMDAWLGRRVPGFDAAVHRGQARVLACEQVHLAGGVFDPDRMYRTFVGALGECLREGYPGLRVSVDMAWALHDVPGVEHLIDFEARGNLLFTDRRLAAVCQYDRRLFDPALLDRACAAHPFTPGQARLRFHTTASPPRLCLAGEVDLTNGAALAVLLGSLVELPRPVTIDARGLTFADIGAAGLLVRAATDRPAGSTVLWCGPALARLVGLIDRDRALRVIIGTPAGSGDERG